MEQNVDIPAVGGSGTGEGLLGLLPGQSSTAFGGARFPAATAEQIVDTPVPHGRRDLPSAASSSGLPGTANQGVFRTFPRGKKCDTTSALEVGTASALEPIHAGCSAGVAGGGGGGES